MARHSHSDIATDKAIRSIDQKRERERKHMLQETYRHAETLAARLVQKLMDEHIVETTSDRTMRELFTDLLRRLSEMEEFDIQYKVAPLRGLVNDPNFISLYCTQYITEDLLEHPKVKDVFGDDEEIYRAVDSVLSTVRPK